MTLPHIGITMGDPAGIGPEITREALRAFAPVLDACLVRESGARHGLCFGATGEL